ncbi:MAG: hypothetical protein ACI8Z1_003200 [Candidatus Azotimanducaceae bacterium]|jgi:hypothetical protein
MADFSEIVETDLSGRIKLLCELFAKEEAIEEYTFFSGILTLLSDPNDEPMILTAVIELSRCAFLGFSYSIEAQAQIDQLLERAINLSETMSATGLN